MKGLNCARVPVPQFRDDMWRITGCEDGRGLYLNGVGADFTENTAMPQQAISFAMDKINGSVLLWECSFCGSLCSFCY
jgi:hypothetical protein